MFVLAYEAPYEGQSVLGVYSSLDAALVAAQRYAGDRPSMYRDMVVREIELDADASLEAGESIMASHFYVNKMDEPIWCFTAFTKGGAWVLAKRYRDKLGSTIVEEPMERDDSMWVFMVTNPFMDAVASS